MKYLNQFFIILVFILLGELLGYLIPLPIAGSIYGLILLFLALCFKIVPLHWVEDIANFFHSTMALLFIAPAVAIIEIWPEIKLVWMWLLVLLVIAYFVSMLFTGAAAQLLINLRHNKK